MTEEKDTCCDENPDEPDDCDHYEDLEEINNKTSWLLLVLLVLTAILGVGQFSSCIDRKEEINELKEISHTLEVIAERQIKEDAEASSCQPH